MLYKSPTPLPESFERIPVFLAGGISNCPNWQDQAIGVINLDKFDVINPRREGDLAKDGAEARRQIEWEHRGLRESVIALFWFPKESICPITLLEYGRMLERADTHGVRIIAGYDFDYQRGFDLEVQTQLAVDWADDDAIAVDLIMGWEDWLDSVRAELGG